jgi:uracil-DNA glycosylase
MSVNPNFDGLIDQLADMAESPGLFNPYASAGTGGAIRRANLVRYLADMRSRRPHALMLFEAPGYRGCALTGIPVTSERVMLHGIARWGLFGEGYRATSDRPGGVAESTSTMLWTALEQVAAEPPLIWNAVPMHPHRPGEPRSNRAPAAAEQRMGLAFIQIILTQFDLQTIMAVGRTAQRALASLGVAAVTLRHPSQGGKPEFVRGLDGVFGDQSGRGYAAPREV